jgi:hypothetical protein
MFDNEHAICIHWNHDAETNTASWVWVFDWGDRWHFSVQDGNNTPFYDVPKTEGLACLLRECRSYRDETTFIYNGHENRR